MLAWQTLLRVHPKAPHNHILGQCGRITPHLILQPVALCGVVPGALGLVALQRASLCHTSINGIDGPLEFVRLWVKVVDVVQPGQSAYSII